MPILNMHVYSCILVYTCPMLTTADNHLTHIMGQFDWLIGIEIIYWKVLLQVSN